MDIHAELLRLAKALTAVRPGETYELDLKEALSVSWATPEWVRLVRATYRRGDGHVTVEKVEPRRGVAMVYEGNNPAARFLGTVQVPLSALRGRPLRAARVSDKDIDAMGRMTDRNDHTGALVYLYEHVLKDRKAANALRAMEALGDYFGHVPYELVQLRYREFYEPGMKLVRQMFDDVTAERIHMAF